MATWTDEADLPVSDAPARPRPVSARPRTIYSPGLDGLRALSVAAVLLYHSGYVWAQGGFIGVEVFFVISGYLITSLLLAEWRSTGGINLPAFWGRRARRLLPALFVMLGVVALVTAVFLRADLPQLRGDLVAASAYVSNWWQIVRHQSYFALMGRQPLLQHLWSLAVEEQFYLIWPVLLLLGLRAAGPRWRWLSLAVLLAALASALGMAFAAHSGADPSRAYYRTDTRASGLLLGSFLGFWWSARRLRVPPERAGRWLVGGIGAVGLLYLTWVVANVNEYDLHLYRGGFLLVDVAACLTIAAAVHPGSAFGPRLLGWAPLRWVGLRSYGIYLWHWPIYMLTRPHVDIALGSAPLLALRLGLTVAVADLSYRYIEQPVRARARRPRPEYVERRFPSLAAVALVLSGLVIAGVLALPTHTTTAPLTVASPGPAIVPRPSAVVVTTTVPTTVRRAFFTPRTTVTSLASPPPPPPPTVPTTLGPPPRVTAVGDSVMLDASAALIHQIPGIWVDASIGRLFPSGLADLTSLQGAGRLGPEVVVHLGTNGILTNGQFDQLLKLLQGEHRVVVVNVSVPRPWEGPVNAVLAAGVKRWPNAVLADWHAVAAAHPQIFWSDGVHLRPEGAQLYAALIAGAL